MNINKIDMNISLSCQLPTALADGFKKYEMLALATYYGAKAEYSACFFPLTEVNGNRKKVIE